MARIIISLPEELLKELDVHAKKEQYNRSEFIRHLIRAFLQKESKKKHELA